MARVSTVDPGYTIGALSTFPSTVDDRSTLYEARNNAETVLKYGLVYNGKKIIVEDASGFPPAGILRIGPLEGEGTSELIYYGSHTSTVFNDLVRGFAGTIQTTWNSNTYVTNSVVAEYHNAIRDALYNVQHYVGLETNPDVVSLNGIVKQLENKFVIPKAEFRAFPTKGPPSLTVRFQSLSGGNTIRYLWDFGDGIYSIEKNPTHTYTAEGFYSVKLTVVTSTGDQGVTVKNNYIKVSEEERPVFFYVQALSSPLYSTATAIELGEEATIFNFVDQTDGDIAQRIWVFGDGNTYEADDPDEHTTTYTYTNAGNYTPLLVVVYANQTIKRTFSDTITVL
jgi:PKD repeat protein